MATSRQQAAEQRRRQLREVAVRVFARQGFAATTTKQLAKEAGVAEGLLFHYFATKLDLLRDVVSEYGGYRLAIGEVLDPLDPGDPRSALAAYCRALLAHLREHADLIAVLAGESQLDSDLSSVFWDVVGDMRVGLAGWLDRAVQAGSIRADASTVAAAHLITSTLSFFFLEHRRLPERQWRARTAEHIDAVVDSTLAGIGARSAPDIATPIPVPRPPASPS
ncbi:TetR/AcrR family transcriptional regulator [Solwaraspora sp. WMMB335]|uniref:TetR/AcrR family transcriptional regulator n=1 Tax=Solwaraspora sp. WMMB335 TaxID=3404118 RepID=UPI003B93193C